MRFAKCTFCVDRRSEAQDVTRSATEKAESKDRLKHHLAWAVTRERGLFHSKIAQHVLDPNSCVCISLDGTDQFIDGFPHFWEKTKQDSKGRRFKFHTEIAVLHGQKPHGFPCPRGHRWGPKLDPDNPDENPKAPTSGVRCGFATNILLTARQLLP